MNNPQYTPHSLIGTNIDNRYIITSHVTSGGMSDIYVVKDSQLYGKEHILKAMRTSHITDTTDLKKAKEYFEREAEILSRLDHHHIVKILDHGTNGFEYIIMEKIDGIDLEKYLRQKGRLSEKETKIYADQILDAFEYMHSQTPPIIFRDMKPSNVMRLTDKEFVKLIDFGIARYYQSGQNVTAFGTPVFAAPEVLRKKAGPESDLYALGTTIYVFLTGTDTNNMAGWCIDPHQLDALCPCVSDNTKRVVEKSMEFDPRNRYQSASEMKDALNNVQQPSQTSLQQPPPRIHVISSSPQIYLPPQPAGQTQTPISNLAGFVITDVQEHGRALKRIDDTKGRIAPFIVDPEIGRFSGLELGKYYHELAKHPNNVDWIREIIILSVAPEAMLSAERKTTSAVVPCIAFMYGERGTTLIYCPEINIKTWVAEGMAYDKGVGWWRPDPKKYYKIQKGLYKEKKGIGQLVVFEPNEFDFPDYKYNGEIAVPFVGQNNATGTLLDVFNIENHGLPERFTDNFTDAVKEYETRGILDSLLKQGSKNPKAWIFYFFRLQNDYYRQNYPVRCAYRRLDAGGSWLCANWDPGDWGSVAGSRFSRWV